jgi:hypothetical protein
MTIGELAQALGATMEQSLRCFYKAAHDDPVEASSARLAPGCTVDELAAAELRIGHSLPPLHRYALTLSTGHAAVGPFNGLVCCRHTARTGVECLAATSRRRGHR